MAVKVVRYVHGNILLSQLKSRVSIYLTDARLA